MDEQLSYFEEIPEETQDKNSISLNTYEINKQIISQLPNLDKAGYQEAKRKIRHYINSNTNTYYMLLCTDLHYYTVMVKDLDNAKKEDTFENVVIDCVRTLGKVKTVEFDSTSNAIEIWLKHEEEIFVMYFFGYDGGVEKCR